MGAEEEEKKSSRRLLRIHEEYVLPDGSLPEFGEKQIDVRVTR